MNSIINIEDRLHIVKQLFELQIKVDAQFDTILLSTEHQKWGQNDFRAECIGANLNDLKQLKTLKNILSLSDEIMNLFLNLPKYVSILNRTTKYTFEGIPYGAKFSGSLLTKKEDGKRYNYLTKENTFSVSKNDDWVGTWSLMKEDHWEDCSYLEIHKKSREFVYNFDNYGFFDFARNTYKFLIDSVFIENKNVIEHVFSDYLTFKDKSGLIEKIRNADLSKPRYIYFILRALFDNGHLVMNDNETIYEMFYAEFGYHKSYDSLKRGLNNYTFEKPDTENQQKIDNMYEHLTS